MGKWRPGPSLARRYTEQELLEVSRVGIPCESECVGAGLKAGALSNNRFADWQRCSITRCEPRKPFVEPPASRDGELFAAVANLRRASRVVEADLTRNLTKVTKETKRTP